MSISKFKIHRRAQFCYSSMIKIPQTMKVLYIFHPKRRLPWNVFKESGNFTILGFPTKKIAFFAWLWPIEAEMENKPSNCWLWLKAMMMKWKCTRTHLHKLSTELFAFRIPAISWNLISTPKWWSVEWISDKFPHIFDIISKIEPFPQNEIKLHSVDIDWQPPLLWCSLPLPSMYPSSISLTAMCLSL